MKTLNQSVTDFTTLSNDANGTAVARTLMNICIHKVLSMSDWTFNKDSTTYLTGTSQQSYSPPYNAAKLNYVNVTVGSITYVPDELRNGKDWAILNNVVVTSDIPSYWYVSNTSRKFSLFPIPSSAGNSIKLGFTKKIRDYNASDYSTGTIGVTSGSTSVVAGGTASWNQSMIGSHLQIGGTNTAMDGFWFEITNVNTGGTLITTREQIPTTASGTYTISETIPFPDGFEDIPLWFALDKYYQMREKPVLAREWKNMWEEGLLELKSRDTRSATGILTKQRPLSLQNPNENPYGITLLNP